MEEQPQEPQFDETGFAKLQAELRQDDAQFNLHAREMLVATALRMIQEAEEMEPGVARRKHVASAVMLFMQAAPVIWQSVTEANPEIPDGARCEMLQRMFEVVFEVDLGALTPVAVVP